jgi:hypothetical protein
MKVKYANGAESHVAAAIGKELVKAGIAEEVTEPITPTEPIWAVVTITGFQKAYAAIQITSGQETHDHDKHTTTQLWAGDPRYANAKKTWPGGFRYINGLGREIPADILKRYVDTIKRNPELLHPQIPGEAIAEFHSQNGSCWGPPGGWKSNRLLAQDKDVADQVLKERHEGLKASGAI